MRIRVTHRPACVGRMGVVLALAALAVLLGGCEAGGGTASANGTDVRGGADVELTDAGSGDVEAGRPDASVGDTVAADVSATDVRRLDAEADDGEATDSAGPDGGSGMDTGPEADINSDTGPSDVGSPPGDTGGATDTEDVADVPPCDGYHVRRLAGQVLDSHGEVPDARLLTLCGAICVRGELEDDGTFLIETDECFPVDDTWDQPMFIYHGAGEYADLHVDFVPEGERDVESYTFPEPLRTIPLEDMDSVTVDEDAAGTLTGADGFVLRWSALALDLPFGMDTLGVAKAGPDVVPPVPGVETLTALYATLPAGTTFDPAAEVEFPNREELAPRTPVEIVALSDPDTPDVYPGTLGVVATGHVTDDGERIVLDEGEGIHAWTWLGYRPTGEPPPPVGPTCPPEEPFGTDVGDTLVDVSLTECDGTPFALHDLCEADATLIFNFYGW